MNPLGNSILNDKQLRQLSMKPTHRSVKAHYVTFSQCKDTWYCLIDGRSLRFKDKKELQTFESQIEPIPEVIVSYPMIEPFVPEQVKTREKLLYAHGQMAGIEDEKIISYGTSSFGYDFRLGHNFKIFSNLSSKVGDPKNFDPDCFVEKRVEKVGDTITIPPNSFILGHTLEYFRMPEDVIGIILSKSTYARIGVACTCTPPEPGWAGYLTLEFANLTPLPAVMYVGEGCAQGLFFRGDRPEVTYADRGGKYQNQVFDAVVAKV